MDLGSAGFVGACRRRTGLALVAVAAAGVGTSAVLAVRPDLPAWTPFLAGALVALACGVVVLAGPVRAAAGRAPYVPSSGVVGVLMLVRGASWLVFAADARDGLGLPSAGDAVSPVVGFVAIAAAVAAGPRTTRTSRTGTPLFALDVLMTTSTTLLGLWVAVFVRTPGPVPGGRTAWALALTAVFVVQLVAGVLVLGSRVGARTGPTILALTLITAGDLAALLTGLDGARHVPAAALAAWCVGWPLLAWRVLTVRSGPVQQPVPGAHTASTLVVGVAGLGVLAAIVGWLRGAPAPSDPVSGALMTASLASFVLHEAFVGRERRRLVSDLADQAGRDPWTRLTNRRGLSDRIRRLPAGSEWAVLALDLDGFKGVNDVHGHARGDAVLAEVAVVLRERCPAGGVAARTGGDEFAMLLPGDVELGRQIGADVVAAVPAALRTLGLAVPITVSVGVGRLLPGDPAAPARPGESRDADPLTPLVEAAAALRAAKELGRNRVQVYPGHVARQRERRLLVESRLRQALADGALTSVGQPLVALTSGRVTAVEALARWNDPVLGAVSPAEFVPVAEDTGLVADLGTLVLRSALAGFAGNGLVATDLVLGVNASPIQLRSACFPSTVRELLEEAGVPPSRLLVEVTEAVLVEPDDPALRVLGDLTDLGVRIAIDDFGSGYSALGYLRRLPVSTVKFDRSLIHEARTTVRTRHMLAGLVDLARRLGVVVVVEGVEDEHGAQLARELGAEVGQGFLLGRPDDWAAVARRATSPARSSTTTAGE